MSIGRTALIVAALFIIVGVVLAVSRMYLPALVWLTLAVSLLLLDPSTVMSPKHAKREGRDAVGLFHGLRNRASVALLLVAIVLTVFGVVNAVAA